MNSLFDSDQCLRGRRASETMSSSNPLTLARVHRHSIRLVPFSSTFTGFSEYRKRSAVPVHKAIEVNRSRFTESSADRFKNFYRSSTRSSFPVSSGGTASELGGSGGGSSGGGSGSGSGGGGGGGGGGDSGALDGGSDWGLLSWYLSLLAKHPVITKAVTSGILNMVGDVICQIMIDQVASLDLKRTFIFAMLGMVLVGPTLHFWYLYLSKLVTAPGVSGAFVRLLLDQFLFSPIFIGAFLSALVTLEGRPSDIMPKLQQEWFSSVLANWKLWIPFQFLNFRFVPQQFQVLASNFIALIWNVILSYKAHKEVIAR